MTQSEFSPLEIIYRDDDLIAINKPSGLLVHRSMIDRHETQFAIQLLRDQIGAFVYPVHRLDKPTSGVLLFALSKEVARSMSEIFSMRETQKEYWAVVRGYIEPKGEIDYPLKEQLDKMTDRLVKEDKPAQEAVTEFHCMGTVEIDHPVGRYQTARYSLAKLLPKTGRKHQLRRHMKHILHPIVGDTKHGRGEHNQFFRAYFGSHRLLLHARRLEFVHPITNKQVKIEAGFDEVFSKVIKACGWQEYLQQGVVG